MTTLSGAGSGSQARTIPLAGALVSAFTAGFAATIIFTLFMWYAGTAIAGFPMDVSQVVAAFLGDNPMLGTMVHYVTGTVAYPVAYLVIRGLLPGPPMLKGALLGILLWLGANIVLLPIVGTGVFMTGLFQGSALIAPQIISVIGHVLFGLILAIGAEQLARSIGRN